MNKRKEVQPSTPVEMQTLVRSMLRGLIGEENRTLELSMHIPYEEIPSDMPFEADVLRVIYICSDRDISPTEQNILAGLQIHCKRNGEAAQIAMADLMTIQTDGNVKFLSRWLDDYLKEVRVQTAAKQALEVVTSSVGTTEERYEQAIGIMGSVSSVGDTATILSEKQRGDLVMDFFRDNAKKLEEGRAIGPSLVLKGFVGERDDRGNPITEGLASVLNWGDVTIISALRGRGKSTIAGMLAEYNAWVLKFDVLFIHLETDHREMEIRTIARNCIVPAKYLRTQPVTKNERLMKKINNFFEWRESREGKIEYCFCPGWDIYRVEAAIRAARMRSEARGKELVVFIDYLGKLDERLEGENSAHLLKQISARVKNITQSENNKSPVHTFLFSQETQNINTGKAYTFGSQAVIDSCQLYISMQREENAPSNLVLPDKDFLGGVRWLHRAGGIHSSVAFKVLKANGEATGVTHATLEGAMYRMMEPVSVGDEVD